tara:strand:- start:5223 stop:5558 length:336 start_codon:yes stop_codon:yes gene_type:complete
MAATLIGLTALGKKAEKIIREYLVEHEIDCPSSLFHSPLDCGSVDPNSVEGAELVLIHEGVDACRTLTLDGAYEQNGGDYSLYEGLVERLRSGGLYLEQMYLWSSTVRTID